MMGESKKIQKLKIKLDNKFGSCWLLRVFHFHDENLRKTFSFACLCIAEVITQFMLIRELFVFIFGENNM